MKKLKTSIIRTLLILWAFQAYGVLPKEGCNLSEKLRVKLKKINCNVATLGELGNYIVDNYHKTKAVQNVLSDVTDNKVKIKHISAFRRNRDRLDWLMLDNKNAMLRFQLFENSGYWLLLERGNDVNQAEGFALAIMPSLRKSLDFFNYDNQVKQHYHLVLLYVEGLAYTRRSRDLINGELAYIEAIKINDNRYAQASARNIIDNCLRHENAKRILYTVIRTYVHNKVETPYLKRLLNILQQPTQHHGNLQTLRQALNYFKNKQGVLISFFVDLCKAIQKDSNQVITNLSLWHQKAVDRDAAIEGYKKSKVQTSGLSPLTYSESYDNITEITIRADTFTTGAYSSQKEVDAQFIQQAIKKARENGGTELQIHVRPEAKNRNIKKFFIMMRSAMETIMLDEDDEYDDDSAYTIIIYDNKTQKIIKGCLKKADKCFKIQIKDSTYLLTDDVLMHHIGGAHLEMCIQNERQLQDTKHKVIIRKLALNMDEILFYDTFAKFKNLKILSAPNLTVRESDILYAIEQGAFEELVELKVGSLILDTGEFALRLPNLKILGNVENLSDENFENFENLRELTALSIKDTNSHIFTGNNLFTALPKLRALRIMCGKAAPDILRNNGNHPQLTRLTVDNRSISIKTLQHFPNLEFLSCNSISNLTKKQPSFVWKKMREINLDNYSYDWQKNLHFFPNVKKLVVRYYTSLGTIMGMAKKEKIHVISLGIKEYYTSHSPYGLAPEILAQPNLQSLYIQNVENLSYETFITIIEKIREITNNPNFCCFNKVSSLTIGDCKISNISARILEFFPNLERFNVYGTNFSFKCDDIKKAIQVIRERTQNHEFCFDSLQRLTIRVSCDQEIIKFFPNIRYFSAENFSFEKK